MFWILESSDKRMKYVEEYLNKWGISTDSNSKNLVLPIRGIDKNGFVADTYINLEEILRNRKIEKIFTGLTNEKLKELVDKYEIELISYLGDEEVIIKNNYITLEGLLHFMADEEISVFDESFLVLGYGYSGQIIAKALKDLRGNVLVYAKDYHDRKSIILSGYEYHDLTSFKDNLIVINTIPSLIFDAKIIDKLPKDTIIIDIASLPGGIDFEYAKIKGIKTSHVLSIPGKYFPKKAGKIIAEYLKKMIK